MEGEPEWAQPSRETMHSIAERIITYSQCKALARRLNLSDKLVPALKANCNDPRKIALDVLKEWLKNGGSSATGRRLYEALEEMDDLRHLAKKHHNALHIQGEKKNLIIEVCLASCVWHK